MCSTPIRKTKEFQLLEKFEKTKSCKIRDFAEFIGKLVFATNGLQYSSVHIKILEREKYLALKNNSGNYDAYMSINHDLLKENFSWWKKNIFYSVNPIKNFDFKLEVFSDSSLYAWGANTKNEKTHGYWNKQEREHRINFLELKASLFGLRCFAEKLRDCDVLMRIDNTTAVSYINRMGGIRYPKLNSVAREIWNWCEARNIWVHASYIKSKENKIADTESRILEPETEFELSNEAFLKIKRKFVNPEIDLFASRVNKKCEKYISWTRDPYAYEIDAFTINWQKQFFYAFPPFSIVARVVRKIVRDQATGILVVPLWNTQPWWPIFNDLLIRDIIIFKPNIQLLLSSDRKPHPLWRNLTLAVGLLSGKPSPKTRCPTQQSKRHWHP